MRPIQILLFAAVFTARLAPALGQEPGDISNGRAIAKDVCAACHAIEDSLIAKSPNPKAPPFRAIAATPGMTDIALLAALRSPHVGGEMPLVLPNTEDVRDVIAYIASLRGPR